MGQAAVDLPDPLQNQAAVGGPSADDLLAQLAGEEIDRLLAEAEVERAVWPQETRSANPGPSSHQQTTNLDQHSPLNTTQTIAAPSAADPHTAAEAMRDSQPQLDPPHVPPTPIAQADVEELDARISKELDSLFTELNSDEPSPAPQTE